MFPGKIQQLLFTDGPGFGLQGDKSVHHLAFKLVRLNADLVLVAADMAVREVNPIDAPLTPELVLMALCGSSAPLFEYPGMREQPE